MIIKWITECFPGVFLQEHGTEYCQEAVDGFSQTLEDILMMKSNFIIGYVGKCETPVSMAARTFLSFKSHCIFSGFFTRAWYEKLSRPCRLFFTNISGYFN